MQFESTTDMVRAAVAGLLLVLATAAPAAGAGLDDTLAGRLAALALDCVHREYPNKIAHVLQSDDDVAPPRELTPAFYGCFDWHSAVHGHWLLVRLARLHPDAAFASEARAALDRNLTPDALAAEARYVLAEGRASFERPYGLAWLLQLAAELRAWDDDDARRWLAALEPLEHAVVRRTREWLPKLSHPIREGEHHQTAFAFGLMLDWARASADVEMAGLLQRRVLDLYLDDRDCPLEYEPSGHDFLSPCLGQADLLRRVLSPGHFAAWLGVFLPQIPWDGRGEWLSPAVVVDPTDGKLAHLDGLNLARAWMLEGVLSGLPPDDPRRTAIRVAAAAHRTSGLRSITGEHYEGGHWLGSFATYLVTAAGLEATHVPSRDVALPDPTQEIGRVLDDWHRAASVADGARYFGHFAPDGVFLGTANGERWDVAAFRAYAEPYFSKGRGWTYVPSERTVSFAPGQDLAWFDERLDSEKYGVLRGSGAMRLIDGAWRIAQYNMTFTVPNDVAANVVEVIAGAP